jgi:hypothetical protein
MSSNQQKTAEWRSFATILVTWRLWHASALYYFFRRADFRRVVFFAAFLAVLRLRFAVFRAAFLAGFRFAAFRAFFAAMLNGLFEVS